MEYEFHSDADDEEENIAPAKAPKYVAPLPDPGKENVAPKTDGAS